MNNPSPKNIPGSFKQFTYPIITRKKLNKEFTRKKSDFVDVILSRKSVPTHRKISLTELSELLYLCTKIKSVQIDENEFYITKRTTPSAGARHPIDLLVSLPEKITKRSFAYYNPIDHSLGELSLPNNCLQEFFNKVNENLSIENSCLIWFSIQVEKTASKYNNPESLYWKDAGALIYCMQLVATYLELKSCPLGTLAQPFFNNLFKDKKIISGGGILIGR